MCLSPKKHFYILLHPSILSTEQFNLQLEVLSFNFFPLLSLLLSHT